MSLDYKNLGQSGVAGEGLENYYVSVAGGPGGNSTTTAAYSTDGITWAESTMPVSARWTSVTYGEGKFIAAPYYSDNAFYSTDGITWTQATIGLNFYLSAVGYGDGKFVALSPAASTNAAYSTDGITWIATTKPVSYSNEWYSITYGNGKFLSVNQSNINGQQLGFTLISTDGITWTESSTNLPSDFVWIGEAAYGDGKFVTVATFSSTAAYSTDGITWTQSTMPTGSGWSSVTYGDGKFVAVAGSYTTAAYSTDGITWTQSTLPASDPWKSVTYGGDKFVTVAGGSGTSTAAAYSTDGITWTQSTLPATENWFSVIHGENLFKLSENNQYTVPSTKEAIISSIYIANNETTSQTYSVAVVPNGETLSNIHYIRKDISIDGNDFHTIGTKITLAEGDQIITEGTSLNVSVNIFGLEK